jgi:hypothetical protein
MVERQELLIKTNKKDSAKCTIHLVGRERYATTIATTAAGTCSTLEHLLNSRILEAQEETIACIAVHRKDYEDLSSQEDKTFSKNDELNRAIAEREQLERSLGLSSNDAIDVIAS